MQKKKQERGTTLMPRRTKPAPMPDKKNFTCPVCETVTDTPYRKHVVTNDIDLTEYEDKTPRTNKKHVKEYYFCSYKCSLEYYYSTSQKQSAWV